METLQTHNSQRFLREYGHKIHNANQTCSGLEVVTHEMGEMKRIHLGAEKFNIPFLVNKLISHY